MSNLILKNKEKIILGLVAVIGFFISLSFFNGKGEKSLTERDRRLMQYDQVQDGDEAIDGTDYVTFDAFFLEDLDNDGNAEGIRGNAIDISKSKNLYIELKVLGEVTLKNGKISFENSNVKVGGNVTKSSVFKTNVNSKNITSLTLNDSIGNGISSLTPLTVEASLTNDLKSYAQTNKVILTGTVVDENGTETEIRKEVSYQADWYGTNVTSYINNNYTTSFKSVTSDSEQNAQVVYKVKVNAQTNMLLKSTNYEGVVGQLNGYDPINVKVDGYNLTSSYDGTTKTFTAKREATLDDTLITSQAYDYKSSDALWNELTITVDYPAAAATDNASVLVSLKSWHEAYNNQGSEFDNIITSTPATKTLVAKYVPDVSGGGDPTLIVTSVEIGSYSSSLSGRYINKTNLLNIYDNVEGNETTKYNRKLTTYFGNYNGTDDVQSIIVKEADYDKLEGTTSLNGIASYSTISFRNLSAYLGTNGYVKMINADTNEVIHVFTALDWNNTYTFESNDVYNLRFETSPLSENAYNTMKEFMKRRISTSDWMEMFTIYETKTLNNVALMNMFTKEEADDLDFFEATTKTDFEYYAINSDVLDTIYEITTQRDTARYLTYISSELDGKIYNGSTEINQLSTVEEKEVKIEIEAKSGYDIIREWKDGEFLVVLPSQILDIDISDVTIDNNNVKVVGYEKVKIDGQKCIRILTENDSPADYKIAINGIIKPDARTTTGSYPIRVYGINPGIDPSVKNTTDDYDVDKDSDTTEIVNFEVIDLTLTAPNEIITTATLTDYNSLDETSVSPEIAEVNPTVDDKDATVEIGIVNSSQFSVKDIIVIGKVGYEGNTYQVGEGDLGSEFDIHMASTGITTTTNSIQDKVTIYYSNIDNPTSDVNNSANNWKTKDEITDFNDIKTYMIVIEDYTLAKGDKVNFTYDVEMPLLTENLNKVTYFTHGVYYNVITDAGDYASSVGGSKLGIRMSRQYDLELTDLLIASDKTIAKSKYLVTDEDGIMHILVTNSEGKAILKDLYVGKEYTIKQLSVNTPYVLDEEEKTFKVINDSNDDLVIESNGKYKSITLDNDKTLRMSLENETRYTIVLKNTDLDTDENLVFSKFKIIGKGYEDGITLLTNESGELTLKNLYLNEVYSVSQLFAGSYLLTNDFTIKLIRDDNGEVKITVAKEPVIGEKVDVSNGFNYNSSYGYYTPKSTSNYATNTSYFPIDLTDLNGDYQIDLTYKYKDSNGYGSFQVYLTDTIGKTSNAYINVTQSTNSNFVTSSITQYDEYPNPNKWTVNQKDLVGGKVYYLYVSYYRYNYNTSYGNFYKPEVKLIGGGVEYLPAAATTNVATYENEYATQTLIDSQDTPVLNVNVKNKKIPTYTLEITKEDANSHVALANAQYKVTGPGLPVNGKYITTDQDGKAYIELQKVYNMKKVNGVDYSSVQGEYTIEEVAAPTGYTLDNKTVTFTGKLTLKNGSAVSGNYETDLATENSNSLEYNLDTESKFKAEEWDNDNNTLKVTMYDYPIISVTKKDAETGELLPNTLFAVYETTTVNGKPVLTPAKDANGNFIGTDIEIDGKNYKLVATDENGALNLNLGAGRYMLEEVQAADDKYTLVGTKYYFGIGETVPYQAAGISLTNNIQLDDYKINSFRASSYVKPTSDGGWIYLTSPSSQSYPSRITKYDKDFNVEWSKPITIYGYGTENEYTFFDEPDKRIVDHGVYSPNQYNAANIIETSDGGFVVRSSNYDFIYKYDKDGNFLWNNKDAWYIQEYKYDRICPLEGNTNDEGQVVHYVYNVNTKQWEKKLETVYNSETGQWDKIVVGYYDLQDYEKKDDDTYYCHSTKDGIYLTDEEIENYNNGWSTSSGQKVAQARSLYYNSPINFDATITASEDGGVYMFYRTSLSSNTDNYFRLSDGTLIPMSNYTNYILKYDANGSFVGVYSLDKLLLDAEDEYMTTYNLQTPVLRNAGNNMFYDFEYDSVYSYPNGDLFVLVQQKGVAAKFRYNATTDSFDKIFFTPISINGYNRESFYDYADYNIDVKLTEDGGFIIGSNNSRSLTSPEYNATHTSGHEDYSDVGLQTYTDENLFYRVNPNDPNYSNNGYNYGYYFMKFDGTGKLDDVRLASSTYRDLTNVSNDLQHIYGSISGGSYVYLEADDSFIFATSASGLSTYGINGQGLKIVELASGEMVIIKPETTYVIYKVNNENKVEWVKQYTGITSAYSSNYVKMRLSSDGKKITLPVKLTTTDPVTELTDDNIPTIQGAVNSYQLLVFDVNEEVTPSGPEAYTLNIENKRKEYKITSTSNVGGEIKVTDPDGNDAVINNGTIETVKYGDDNVNTITITPDAGYVISSVKVNGEDASYKVNDDGSVTLDTIKDIKENKSIQVTFEYGKSQVIVKHYLNGTTDSVFSDEIITGTITTPYKVEPKTDYLYSVASTNGELILPDNMEGTFAIDPITVIFYYVENEVELKTNYYIEGTETELAPSNVERKVLGSAYQTAPLNITNYELTRTIGDETGTLTRNVTEVTYMYQESTESKITIRYVDKATNKDIIDPIVKTVTKGEPYTTDDAVTIPANYKFTSVSGETSGTANDAEIEVIYYYEVIPFNVKADKKINSVLLNGEKQTITDSKNVVISPFKKDNLIVYYEINVENTGDIKATFNIVEEDIKGFVIYDKGQFTETSNGYELNIELEPGAKASYKIGYKWNQKDYGISTNKVELKEVTNPNGFDEPDSDDNISTATVETKIPKEVLDDDVIIPNTIDKVRTSIALFITSLCGVILTIILMRKKRMN